MDNFVKFIGAIVLVVASSIWGGYVISVLWGWFIVPLGIISISIVHAIGISIVISTFLGTRGLYDGEKDLLERTVAIFLYPSFALLFGGITNSFM